MADRQDTRSLTHTDLGILFHKGTAEEAAHHAIRAVGLEPPPRENENWQGIVVIKVPRASVGRLVRALRQQPTVRVAGESHERRTC